MHEGLLWYDGNQKRSTEMKIDAAAERFVARQGREPNCCHVHPGQVATHPRLQVVADPRIKPGYFWVGVDESLVPVRRGPKRYSAA